MTEIGAGGPTELGVVEAIFRYPVKSMAGERLDVARMGWHGLDGDRRLAIRKKNDHGGFPWLTASRLQELLLFTPCRRGEDGEEGLPTHVRTPDGEDMEIFGDALAADIARRLSAPVEMMRLKHGIFDEAPISVITVDTVHEICRLAGRSADVRRFRPNILLRTLRQAPFEEDAWVGSVLSFGDAHDAAAVTVTMRDTRCSMINLDPDSAAVAPEMMKAAVRANENTAGIYGAVTRIGSVTVGQTVRLHSGAKR
ncbi:MAG: MOSC domain-containing protein [bacterium]